MKMLSLNNSRVSTDMETKTKECEMDGDNSRRLITVDCIGEDLLRNVVCRLRAVDFASSACVSRSWNRLCNSILSIPKFSSALSLNPSIEVAVDEVFSKVFGEPIRPHFAIVSVGSSFGLHEARSLVTAKLGYNIPIICTRPFGLMGKDVATDTFKELEWEESDEEDDVTYGSLFEQLLYEDPNSMFPKKTPKNPAVLLTVGFLPGLKVAAVTLQRTDKVGPLVDEFVTDIRECSAIHSGQTSPLAIMLFADIKTDTDCLLEKLDYAMSPETVIVGDGSGVLLCGGNCQQENHRQKNFRSNNHSGVALLFMCDRDKPHSTGIGTIRFDVALSPGMSPVGPKYMAVSVREKSGEGTTWLTAKREGLKERLDGQTILNQIYDEMPDRVQYPAFYLGIVKRRKCFVGSDEVRWITSQVFHQVDGGDEEYLYVEGSGIRTGDFFRVFQTDSNLALSTLRTVRDKFRSLKQNNGAGSSNMAIRPTHGANNTIFGGFVFTCSGRGEHFFGKPNVDSAPFLENFPGVTLAGLFCGGEICRGDSSSYDQESQQGSYRCSVHSFSSVYLIMSYTPTTPKV